MVRLTIYRIGATVEITFSDDKLPYVLKSGEIYTIEHSSGEEVESIRIRPYYRRTIDGVLNIFAEEEVDLRN